MVLVTSGAIATGVARLAPARAAALDAGEAGGGGGRAVDAHAALRGRRSSVTGSASGQVLLTAQDISDRARYLNARNTLRALLRFGVLPVVNENDTVAVEEIKVGDNDNLSALVALAHRRRPARCCSPTWTGCTPPTRPSTQDARLLETVEAVTDEITRPGVGGQRQRLGGRHDTKLQAAQKAAAAGVPMIIASGRAEGVLARLFARRGAGHVLRAARPIRLGARKRWIAFAVPPQGRLTVDARARSGH